MVPVSDAKAQEYLAQAKAEADPPAPAAPEAKSEPTQDAIADTAEQEAPTAEAEKPAGEAKSAKAPDLSWLPEEYREGFKSLPPESQKYLREARAHLIRGADEKFQAAAALKKDAEKWRRLEADPEFRRKWVAFSMGKPTEAPTEKPAKAKAKWLDVTSDEEFDALVESKAEEIARRVVEGQLSAPKAHARQVDAAIEEYRESLGESVDADLFQGALKAMATDLAEQAEDGVAYNAVKPEQIKFLMPAYLRAAKAEAQAAGAAKPTPSPMAAKAASIKSSGAGGPAKPAVTYKRPDGKPLSPEEFFVRFTRDELGLTPEQLSELRREGSLIR